MHPLEIESIRLQTFCLALGAACVNDDSPEEFTAAHKRWVDARASMSRAIADQQERLEKAEAGRANANAKLADEALHDDATHPDARALDIAKDAIASYIGPTLAHGTIERLLGAGVVFRLANWKIANAAGVEPTDERAPAVEPTVSWDDLERAMDRLAQTGVYAFRANASAYSKERLTLAKEGLRAVVRRMTGRQNHAARADRRRAIEASLDWLVNRRAMAATAANWDRSVPSNVERFKQYEQEAIDAKKALLALVDPPMLDIGDHEAAERAADALAPYLADRYQKPGQRIAIAGIAFDAANRAETNDAATATA